MGQLSRIAFVIPYFGRLPNYFQLYLTSCKHNPTIDWFLFTNDRTKFDYPENVHVTYESSEEAKKRFQRCFDFEIVLDRPYKLCDFKPSYGEVFAECFRDHDFWGFCDIDVIYGNIRTFMTEEILNTHEKILTLGHFSLFRNVEKINQLYRGRINGELAYKKVFSTSRRWDFDERGPYTIQALCQDQGIRVFDSIVYADISIEKYHFQLSHFRADAVERRKKCTVFTFNQGQLTRMYVMDGKKCEEEYLYIHLQKRPMELGLNDVMSDRFLIVPNRFLDFSDNLSIEDLSILGKHRPIYFHNAWRVFKERAKVLVWRWISILFRI